MSKETRTFQLWDSESRKVISVSAKKTSQAEEFQALCPFHNDTIPSLFINNQKKVYYCQGCSKAGKLYDPTLKKNTLLAFWDYRNEQGKLLFQTVKYIKEGGKKSFYQRHQENGGWISDIKGIGRVLYRLPELIASDPDAPVLIPEGEKDVDNLRELGFVATCNPMGAGKGKWKKEYNGYLENRKVILLPDNDKEGKDHTQEKGNSLFGTANTIKYLELPGLKKKEDVSDWIARGGTKEKLLDLIEKAPEFEKTEEKSRKQKTEEKAQKKEKVEIKTLIPGLIHLVRENDQIKYLIKNENKLEILPTYTVGEKTFKPKQDLPMQMLTPDILDQSLKVNYKDLLDDVSVFIRQHLELPTEEMYLILSLWVFHTYLIEKFNSTPLLYFFGIKETGKTKAGEVLSELAFKCERLTSPTEATLFRSAHYFKTTLVIDEIKLWGPDGDQEVARLIKSRYKKGLVVSRIDMKKGGEAAIEYFDVFAPLVICTTETIPDIIESRCVTFTMQKNTRPEVEKPIDRDWARQLRNKLTVFRAEFFEKNLPEGEQVARRRLGEILTPLYQTLMLIDPTRKEEFQMVVEKLEKKRQEEESLELEAEIVEEIRNYQIEKQVNSFLTTELAERLNSERSEKDKYSDRLISMRIKRLGFEKTRLGGGKMGFRINSQLLEKLALRFGLNTEENQVDDYEESST